MANQRLPVYSKIQLSVVTIPGSYNYGTHDRQFRREPTSSNLLPKEEEFEFFTQTLGRPKELRTEFEISRKIPVFFKTVELCKKSIKILQSLPNIVIPEDDWIMNSMMNNQMRLEIETIPGFDVTLDRENYQAAPIGIGKCLVF